MPDNLTLVPQIKDIMMLLMAFPKSKEPVSAGQGQWNLPFGGKNKSDSTDSIGMKIWLTCNRSRKGCVATPPRCIRIGLTADGLTKGRRRLRLSHFRCHRPTIPRPRPPPQPRFPSAPMPLLSNAVDDDRYQTDNVNVHFTRCRLRLEQPIC